MLLAPFRGLLTFLMLAILAAYPALADTRVVAPLTGTVNTGTWVEQQSWSVAAMPHGQMTYDLLFPQGYDPNGTIIYPLLVMEHTNDGGGGGSYTNGTNVTWDLGNGATIDGAFNNTTWRRRYPAIILNVYADQTIDPSGANGNANFGCYADTPNSGGNEQGVASVIQHVLATTKADPTRVYGTGWSLGGIGMTAEALDANAVNGTPKLFAALMPIAGQCNRPSAPPITGSLEKMRTVPLMELSGSNDGTSPPESFNRPAWRYFTGNSNYPNQNNLASGGVAALKAGSTNYYYLEDTRYGHSDMYFNYGATSAGYPLYDWMFAQTSGPAPGGGTGKFSVSGGKIIGPNGQPWFGRGVNTGYGLNADQSTMNTLCPTSACTPLVSTFPGINFIRFTMFQTYPDPNIYANWVAWTKALGIVTVFENHQNNNLVYTGSQLTTESNWYAAMAARYKDEPYVMYESINEPGNNDSPQQVATQNAIRGAGSNQIVIHQAGVGGGNPGTVGAGCSNGLNASSYSSMTNIVWDLHSYNWTSNMSTDQPTVDAALLGSVAGCKGILGAQSIRSADGLVPVIIGEFGNSTNGADIDAGGVQTVAAVLKSQDISGYQAWAWAPGGSGDVMLNSINGGQNNLTAYGKQVADAIKAGAAQVGETISLNTINTVSQNTAFSVSGNITALTTPPTLQYQDNGGSWLALPSGSTVTATSFSFTHPGMAANPNTTVSVRDANNTSIMATGPPFIVAGPESANNTVVTTAGPSITNSVGEVWTLTSSGQIAVNGTVDGTSANVIELAYVNHQVWQENSSNLWWAKTRASDAWSPPDGTSTSPITAPPPAETLSVNSIGTQSVGTAFTVSGVVGNATTAPHLQYSDNGGAWQEFPGGGGTTRNSWEMPGATGSFWVTPFGNGTTYGAATDIDTIDIARGWDGSNFTAGPYGNINTTENYGNTYYVGKASDPVFSFSATLNDRTQGPESGGTISAQLHVPVGAITGGPYGGGGDYAMILSDPVNQPGRVYYFGQVSSVGIAPPGLQPGQGPFNTGQGGWEDVTSPTFGHDADTGMSGFNLAAGLINYCDVDATCNPSFPKIKHGLRMSLDSHLLKDNAVVFGQQVLKQDSWPNRLQDFQQGINLYSGNLKFGTTLGIPLSTPMPGNLDANCQGMFWTMQHYPTIQRDMGGGGFNYTVDQVASVSSFIASVRSCLPQLVALMRPVRNQHQTGQDFTTFPINGPGTRSDTGPPPLAGTGGSGGTSSVTTTSFTFQHPAMAAGVSNTVAIRDANNTTISATSAAFAVGSGQVAESLSVGAIANQIEGNAFPVSGSIAGVTAVPGLQYQDGSAGWNPLPQGAIVSTTSFSFTHPGMSATSSATVSIRDQTNQTITTSSNVFQVVAGAVEAIVINPIATQQATAQFTVAGTVAHSPASLTLQYRDNAGAWFSLPSGSSVTVTPTGGTNTPVFTDEFASLSITENGGPPTGAIAKVLAGSGNSFTDSGGNVWTINSSNVVLENGSAAGFSANVAEIDLVSGTVWQKNTSNSWYFWTGSTWTAGNDPTAGGAAGSWMNHYPFGGSEYTLSANNEAEYYASSTRTPGFNPFSVTNGILSIIADSVAHTVSNPLGLPYNSGAITSSSETSGVPTPGLYARQYGYFAVSAKLPAGRGLWPAIWLEPQAGGAGEIDIMEALGHDLTHYYTTLHYGGSTAADEAVVPISDYSLNFHEYAVNWQADFVTFYLDGVQVFRRTTPPEMKQPYYLLMNLAVGAVNSWPGPPDGSTVFPAKMQIDYVHVYPDLPTAIDNSATFSFIHPGLAAATSTTVGVRDAGNNAIVATSNSFIIQSVESANNLVVLAGSTTPVIDQTGEKFTITSGGQVAVNGVTDTGTANVTALAYVNHTVWYHTAAGLWFSKTISTGAWIPPGGTLTSPLPAETITINAIPAQASGAGFTVSGVIGASLVAPTLQYSVSGGAWANLPNGSPVSNAAFSFVVPGINVAGNATVSVRDAGTISISATSNTFVVAAPLAELLSMHAISNQPVGTPFTVSGNITNATRVPVLQYRDNTGPWLAFPSGSSTTQVSYSFIHPGLGASQSVIVQVRDSAQTGVTAQASAFIVVAQESANLSVVTTVGPQIIDGSGNSFTLTAGQQVAINGAPDGSTSHVIEIAYINHQVWYENSNLQWWSRSVVGAWGPTGGTLSGPLPSSRVSVFLTSTRPLAVVNGFTIGVPGIQINDTVVTGAFSADVLAQGGILTMPGANGSGTNHLTLNGAMATVNQALSGLQFTGRTVGVGSVVVTVRDAAQVSSRAQINITVARSPGVIAPGRAVLAPPKPRRRRAIRRIRRSPTGRVRQSVPQRVAA